MTTIIGIDPSLTATAVCRGDEHGYEITSFSSANRGDDVAARMERCDTLVDCIVTWLSDRPRYDAIFIEGYSFGSNDARARFSAEYGGLLRWHLLDLTDRVYEVAPHTLKKFATGKGAGKKDMVIAHLTKRYGVVLASNDEYDAFALFTLGLVVCGMARPDNQAQREAADKVLGIAAATKKKRKEILS